MRASDNDSRRCIKGLRTDVRKDKCAPEHFTNSMDAMSENTFGVRVPERTLAEEILNFVTHGLGLALSVAGAVYLLSRPEMSYSLWVGCWIYSIALIALYAASTMSHSFVSDSQRVRYRTLDQICIFLVIAATYTPVSLKVCSDGWWNLPLVLIWLLAASGTYLKLRVTREKMVPVWFYVLTGWIPVVAIPRYSQHFGTDGLFWIGAGALCYVIGVVFLTNDHRNRFFHPIWHIMVIMGSVCHYIVICDYTVNAA